MSLSLSDLISPRSPDDWKAQLLLGLQGVGFVSKTGSGTGKGILSGASVVAADLIVEIVVGGEPGVATYRYSLDKGATWASTATTPASGATALGSSGVLVSFLAGPERDGRSFIALDRYAAELSVPTFPVTSWQPGSAPLTQIELFASGAADLHTLVGAIAKGGFVGYATGAWMELLAKQLYDLDRNAGIAAKHTILLTDAQSAGPFTLTAGQIWAASTTGKRFYNEAGGTLVKGGTLSLSFVAEASGSAYNAGVGQITTLLTSLPGVAITNTALTQNGTDPESDAALAARCKARWPSLAPITASPNSVYELWAKTAHSEVTRAQSVASPTVPGQVDVYLAGAAGAVSTGARNAADAYIQSRVALTNTANVASATNTPVAVTATIYVQAAFRAAAQAVIPDLIAGYINGLPLAGSKVRDMGIVEVMMAPVGVNDVALSLPAGDLVGTTGNVFTVGTLTLTYVEE